MRTPHRKFLVRALSTTALLVLLSFITLASGPPARAAVGDLTCTVSLVFTFSPPLTTTRTTTSAQASAQVADCISPNGHFSSLTSGTVQANATATSQGGIPCNLLLTISGTGAITWNTGQTSGYSFTISTNPIQGTITVSATVTSGPMAGDVVTLLPVEVNPNLDCAVNGLSSLTSVAAEAVYS